MLIFLIWTEVFLTTRSFRPVYTSLSFLNSDRLKMTLHGPETFPGLPLDRSRYRERRASLLPGSFIFSLGRGRRHGLRQRWGICEHLSPTHNLSQALIAGLPAKLNSFQLRRQVGGQCLGQIMQLCPRYPYVPGRSAAYENQALLAELWAPATVKKVIALKALAQTTFQRRACFWGTEPCTRPVPVPVPDQTENKNIQVKCRPTPRRSRSCLIRLGIW